MAMIVIVWDEEGNNAPWWILFHRDLSIIFLDDFNIESQKEFSKYPNGWHIPKCTSLEQRSKDGMVEYNPTKGNSIVGDSI